MFFRISADAVLLLHLAFIAFALLGGALGRRWRWMPLLHLPAAAWGFFVELSGRACPLTELENALRARAGDARNQSGADTRHQEQQAPGEIAHCRRPPVPRWPRITQV